MNNLICNCRKCNLYKNQLPLLDNLDISDVMWVGLSAKTVNNIEMDIPLSNNTNSGKLISDIEENFNNVSFYKTNLVKCVPFDINKKLRYPNMDEMNKCIDNLLYEIEVVKPKIIFLLGKKVSTYFNNYIEKNNIQLNISIYSINHPSYMMVYKRKEISKYTQYIIDIINNNLFL